MYKLLTSRKGVIQEEGDSSQLELVEKVREMIIEKSALYLVEQF